MKNMLEWYDKKIEEYESQRIAGLSICDDAVVKISERIIDQYKELKATIEASNEI